MSKPIVIDQAEQVLSDMRMQEGEELLRNLLEDMTLALQLFAKGQENSHSGE